MWFDHECKAAKKKLKKKVNRGFGAEGRACKVLIRKKKCEVVAMLPFELREFKAYNPREFWRLIDKITNHSTGEEMPISVEDLGEYFPLRR